MIFYFEVKLKKQSILICFFLNIFSGQDNVMGLVTSLRIGSSVCLVMPYVKHDHPLVIINLVNALLYVLQIKPCTPRLI